MNVKTKDSLFKKLWNAHDIQTIQKKCFQLVFRKLEHINIRDIL